MAADGRSHLRAGKGMNGDNSTVGCFGWLLELAGRLVDPLFGCLAMIGSGLSWSLLLVLLELVGSPSHEAVESKW